ncbi:ribonuclease P protein component [Allostreptomyces psammosilenae]|uniref:ribonuclease P protein component n=1 Tax=Allostreptomyces psammosilenae TaxID=1892865 RepID=UPI0015C986D0|nr:ribonuclease P protein component [Allostreptomyces psammosilenae]
MLPSDNRLRRRQDFATAVRRGRRAGRHHLVVHLHAAPEPPPPVAAGTTHDPSPHGAAGACPPPRAGFVVSKAVGPAVVRNKVKRRLRHLVRERLDRLPAGSLLVVRALPPAADGDVTVLAEDLDAALRRLLTPRGGGRPDTAPTRPVPAAEPDRSAP